MYHVALKALSFLSIFSAAEKLAGICASPFNASTHLFWIKTVLIFTFHNQ
jgi:hypothetical protein